MEALFPPELILFMADKIGLSDEQRAAVRAQVEQAAPQSKEFQEQLQHEATALSELVHQSHIDPAALEKQLDAVLEAERGLQQLHFGTLAALKNLLTPEQQAKLTELKRDKSGAQEEIRTRLKAKGERFKEGIQKMQADGRDPAPVGAIMKDFEPLLKSGKMAEAEAVLDRALQAIETAVK